MRISPYPHC
uniref:Uncharacterized protein n=1 Tax=Anguilla anguilla TaxID=7936 RepID=A0A0E9PFS4_ANGAN